MAMKQPDWEGMASFYYDKLVEFVYDILRVEEIDKEQERVLRAIETEPAVAVKSGHGVGKTAIESWTINWFMFTRPFARIPCTAPTGRQLNDVLWPEVLKWYKNSYLYDFRIFEWTKTRFYFNHPDYKELWFATPRTSNKPDNLQGFHEENLMFVVDEASGIPQNVMEVVEGALTEDNAKLLLFGNPTQVTGTFYDAFNSQKKFYYGITINAENSSRVSKKYVQRIYDKYGYHSNVARIRVRGEFPTQEADTIIPIDLIEKAAMREVIGTGNYIDIGVDVARFGDDETVLYLRRGMKVMKWKIMPTSRTTEISSLAAMWAKEYNRNYTIRIKVDVTGLGGGVVDELVAKNLQNTIIYEIGFGDSANDEKYDDRATEMYFHMKEVLENNEVELPDDEELRNQLAARKYEVTLKDKVKIESKKKFKERTGQSPDRADAMVLCFYNPEKGKISLKPGKKPPGF